MTATAKREWVTFKRRHVKACDVLDHAKDHLSAASERHPDDYAFEMQVMAAMALLDQMLRQLHVDYAATVKRLGVGTYTPYGRQFSRKW